MSTVLTFGFIATILYHFIQFARQEHLQDDFEDTIIDVEARLEWARTRSIFPFGMQAQIEVSTDYLGRAKNLWQEKKWPQAYRTALQAQEAMNRAQRIYSTVIRKRSATRNVSVNKRAI